jgi:hypothetical protein
MRQIQPPLTPRPRPLRYRLRWAWEVLTNRAISYPSCDCDEYSDPGEDLFADDITSEGRWYDLDH